MVVKMMRWRPLASRKFEVNLCVHKLQGLAGDCSSAYGALAVEVKWKGPKASLTSFRRTTLRTNCTSLQSVLPHNDAVCFDEEFYNVVELSELRDANVFHPWEITFTLFDSNGLTQGVKGKLSLVGTAMLNLGELAAKIEEKEFQLCIPLSSTASELHLSLSLSISLVELRTAQEPHESIQRPVINFSSPPSSGETPPAEKDELSALKAGLRKVKILTEYVSARRAKKACREEESIGGQFSAEGEYGYPFDSESQEESDGGESDESKEDSTVRKSFNYGTLAYANYMGGPFYSSTRVHGQDENWIYYSHQNSDVSFSHVEESLSTSSDTPISQNSRRSILPWRKRKMSFRSPKSKGETLLKKYNEEEGGDDIDYDRRQLSSDEYFAFGWQTAHRQSMSEFGDDKFAVGSWEKKEITSRDGQMKLQIEVFFASIDQRSEQAAGESACTALVAVIADWLQNNNGLIPIKSQFDGMIREGSSEWRKLCKNDEYRRRFPDRHFDLETILQAKIRPISVVPGKSFIGFFHADGMDEGKLEFLHGAMSFDNIWDEISKAESECLVGNEPQVYIVSWNDHFFVLKVETDAYYLIDSLGERLHEGCNQAYVLKFDRDTTIFKLPSKAQSQEETPHTEQQIVAAGGDKEVRHKDSSESAYEATGNEAKMQTEEEIEEDKVEAEEEVEEEKEKEKEKEKEEGKEKEEIEEDKAAEEEEIEEVEEEKEKQEVEEGKGKEKEEIEEDKAEAEERFLCQGKECCKEYIKSFLAAIPIRELQEDMKRGLITSTPVHHRLQIEFHFTQSQEPTVLAPAIVAAAVEPQTGEAEVDAALEET